MDVTIKDITTVEKELTVNIPAAELEPRFEKAYQEYQSHVELRGFRKGKAPLGMVKKMFGEAIEYQSLENIAQEVFRKTLEERAVNPIGQPVLRDMDFKRGEAFSFKIVYEIMPEIALKEYKGIPVEKILHTVTDDEVKARYERLLRRHSTMQEVESAPDANHLVHADFQELDDAGSPIIGKKIPEFVVDLSSNEFLAEIREPLVGVAKGETRRVKSITTDDGKETPHLFDATVKKIERIVPPELNPEMIKTLSGSKATTAEELHKHLRAELEHNWKHITEDKLTHDLIDEIVRRNDFDVPETFIKTLQDEDIQAMKARQPNKKFPSSFNEEEYRKETRARAIWQAKWALLREKILEAEAIKATDEDLERLAEENAAAVGMEKDKLLNFYKTSDAVKSDIIYKKLMALLTESAKITEKKEEDQQHEGRILHPKEPELLVAK